MRDFLVATMDAGRTASTAGARLNALKQYAAWLVDEKEATTNQIAELTPPKVDQKVIQPFTDEELSALLRACRGKDLAARRDTALLRLMSESGIRAGEAAGLHVEHVDLHNSVALVQRGKGGKQRRVPFGPNTAQAIDRYLRVRRGHPLAKTPHLWLGANGQGFTYQALWKALGARATAAGVVGFHPHRLRHTFAHRWLSAGGSEQGMIAVAGWERPDMVMRYSRARASDRAIDEARGLGLGEGI